MRAVCMDRVSLGSSLPFAPLPARGQRTAHRAAIPVPVTRQPTLPAPDRCLPFSVFFLLSLSDSTRRSRENSEISRWRSPDFARSARFRECQSGVLRVPVPSGFRPNTVKVSQRCSEFGLANVQEFLPKSADQKGPFSARCLRILLQLLQLLIPTIFHSLLLLLHSSITGTHRQRR